SRELRIVLANGFGPLLVRISDRVRARNRFRRHLAGLDELLVKRFREETGAKAVVATVVHRRLASDDELATASELAILLHFRGLVRPRATFVPRELDGRQLSTRRELVLDNRRLREGYLARAFDLLQLHTCRCA